MQLGHFCSTKSQLWVSKAEKKKRGKTQQLQQKMLQRGAHHAGIPTSLMEEEGGRRPVLTSSLLCCITSHCSPNLLLHPACQSQLSAPSPIRADRKSRPCLICRQKWPRSEENSFLLSNLNVSLWWRSGSSSCSRTTSYVRPILTGPAASNWVPPPKKRHGGVSSLNTLTNDLSEMEKKPWSQLCI